MPHTRRLFYQSHILHSPSVLRARRNDVQPCGVDAAVTEHIGELRDILIHFIEHPRKQMSEIVREHLIRAYARVGTDRFHIPPDVCPINGKPAPRNKYHTALYPMLFCIIKQPISQFRTRKITRALPLQRTTASPHRAASTVTKRSSLTRIPVLPIVCSISPSLALLRSAARHSR